jgi:peptide/nickel transport system substrate-binding protein
MRTKHTVISKLVLLAVVVSLVAVSVGCSTPAPEVVEKVVTQIVKETVIVEGTPQVVEKEVTKIVEVEKVVTPTPGPKELVVGTSIQYGESFDIFTMATSDYPHSMIYEPLVSLDYDYQFQPGLAESWEVSEDGLTTTFYLKKGVTFHDGSDFNAEVVEWWVGGMKGGASSYMVDPITEVEIIDEHTIAFKTESPFPNLFYNLSTSFCYIMSQEAYEKYGDEYGTKYAVGTGPFMLEEWVQNDYFTLVKNPDYNWAPEWTGHEGPANVDKITYRILPEDATRMIELQAGNVHLVVAAPSPREFPQYQNNPDYIFTAGSASTIYFIGMNVNGPLVKDIRTRKAIGHAIDRDLIVETIYQGMGRATNTYLPGELGGDKGVSQYAPSYDLEKAEALLAEAGWVMGDDGILVAESVEGLDPGTKFETSYWTYQEDQFKRLAEVTQNMLAEVGIKLNAQFMDMPTYSDGLKGGDFQIILRQYGWDNNDIIEWFHHSKYLPYPNYLGVNDPEFDAMQDYALYEVPTWEERDVAWVDIHKYLIEEWYPWAPFYQPVDVFIGRSSLENFKPIPLRGVMSPVVWTLIDLEE